MSPVARQLDTNLTREPPQDLLVDMNPHLKNIHQRVPIEIHTHVTQVPVATSDPATLL